METGQKENNFLQIIVFQGYQTRPGVYRNFGRSPSTANSLLEAPVRQRRSRRVVRTLTLRIRSVVMTSRVAHESVRAHHNVSIQQPDSRPGFLAAQLCLAKIPSPAADQDLRHGDPIAACSFSRPYENRALHP